MEINYKAEHTPALFHADKTSLVRGIMGPIGSGKSVAMCMELFMLACQQAPNKHGVRQTRWAVVRGTYPELKSTTIETWQDWFPQEICPIVQSSPIKGRMIQSLGDGTTLDMQLWFIPLDKPKDLEKLGSLELTGAFINEARELNFSLVDKILERTGRFPGKKDGAPLTWSGMIMDTNPPDDDHWWYKMAEEKKPSGWTFYRQPGGMVKGRDGQYYPNPKAENIDNLPLGYDYYRRLLSNKSNDAIKVYILGEYGSIVSGRPVWPEYRDDVHFSPVKLEPQRGLPLILGWDFGLTPACIFLQLTPIGQLIVLDELIVTGTTMGIKQFATEHVKPHIANHYNDMSIQGFCDPAGSQRSQADEKTCMQMLALCGLKAEPASTDNTFFARRESVADYMRLMLGDGTPGFLLSNNCKILRKALNGGYMYERMQVTGSDDRFKDVACKNKFSHPADALQYGVMGISPNTQRSVKSRARKVINKLVGGWA